MQHKEKTAQRKRELKEEAEALEEGSTAQPPRGEARGQPAANWAVLEALQRARERAAAGQRARRG